MQWSDFIPSVILLNRIEEKCFNARKQTRPNPEAKPMAIELRASLKTEKNGVALIVLAHQAWLSETLGQPAMVSWEVPDSISLWSRVAVNTPSSTGFEHPPVSPHRVSCFTQLPFPSIPEPSSITTKNSHIFCTSVLAWLVPSTSLPALYSDFLSGSDTLAFSLESPRLLSPKLMIPQRDRDPLLDSADSRLKFWTRLGWRFAD